MVARLILETDIIEVSRPPLLVYGQPGAGKTSLAQTAKNPFTFDFDNGAHRSGFRKNVLRVDKWEDAISMEADVLGVYHECETVVVDTVGTCLEYMGNAIMASNPKLGTRAGGLSQQGWGVLKGTFNQWRSSLIQAGKQVIFIAHQKEEKDGDNRMLRPDIAGGSYSIVMNSCDIVGYLSYRNNHRHIAWEPTDQFFAKNGAQLASGPIPDFKQEPNFLAKLLEQAKANLGHTAEASALVAKATEKWQSTMKLNPTIDQLNDLLPTVKELSTPALRIQAFAVVEEYAKAKGWAFNKEYKLFVDSTFQKKADEFAAAPLAVSGPIVKDVAQSMQMPPEEPKKGKKGKGAA